MFGVSLGIRVGNSNISGGGFDADAQAYFSRVTTAGGTLTTTEQNAVNQLVIDMKAAGIWTSMKAIYPMVGASAAACAQNLKSSSFTGTFSSGWTFASTGVTPNGTSAFMETNFIPTTNFNSLNDKSFGVYIGTNTNNGVEMGSLLSSNYRGDQIATRITNVSSSFNSNLDAGSVASSDSKGFWVSTRSSSLSGKYYKNNTSIITLSASTSQNSSSIFLGARRVGSGPAEVFSDKRLQLAFMGDGLTDTQASDFYTSVQTFQTTLSRNV